MNETHAALALKKKSNQHQSTLWKEELNWLVDLRNWLLHSLPSTLLIAKRIEGVGWAVCWFVGYGPLLRQGLRQQRRQTQPNNQPSCSLPFLLPQLTFSLLKKRQIKHFFASRVQRHERRKKKCIDLVGYARGAVLCAQQLSFHCFINHSTIPFQHCLLFSSSRTRQLNLFLFMRGPTHKRERRRVS